MFELPRLGKKANELPVYEQEKTVIRVCLQTERSFALYLAEKKGSSRMATVNRRKARVIDCRVVGLSVLEVDLLFCDFAAIKRV